MSTAGCPVLSFPLRVLSYLTLREDWECKTDTLLAFRVLILPEAAGDKMISGCRKRLWEEYAWVTLTGEGSFTYPEISVKEMVLECSAERIVSIEPQEEDRSNFPFLRRIQRYRIFS